MSAGTVSRNKLLAHPDILNQRNVGGADIGTTTALNTGGNIGRGSVQPFFTLDCLNNHCRL